MTTQAHLYKQDDALQIPATTGWPTPDLMQDDHRPLFRWFASKLDARVRVREACAEIGRSALGREGGDGK